MPTDFTQKRDPAPQHCRFCQHDLEDNRQPCPKCGKRQTGPGQILALAVLTVLLGMVVVLLLNDSDKFWEVHIQEDLGRLPMQFADPPEKMISAAKADALAPQTLLDASFLRLSKRSMSQETDPAVSSSRPQASNNFPFYVAEKKWNERTKAYDFYRKGMRGKEVPLRADARSSFISEDQRDYHEPKSGCGPTALLNLYIWYSKFGLLKESVRHANPRQYKKLKFQQIDRKLLEVQRQSRSEQGGTNSLAAVVVMDELVQQYSTDPVRLHFEIKHPPLSPRDFIALSRNYRAGILSVRPKEKKTGKLLENHAVLCIRADRSGMITIANWGEFSLGRLVSRPDGQWFIPKDPNHHELRINNLTTLIPFVTEK